MDINISQNIFCFISNLVGKNSVTSIRFCFIFVFNAILGG